MNTLTLLNNEGIGALEALGISVNQFDDLYVLNYSQIDSPKFNPVVQECRSLVVNKVDETWCVVSRSFDRFYNLGEGGLTISIEHARLWEKMDGSLINFYYYAGEWRWRTRSMIGYDGPIYGSMNPDGSPVTWFQIMKPLVDAVSEREEDMDTSKTYIFELFGPHNSPVVKYDENDYRLLAIRDNDTGQYSEEYLDFKRPREYVFGELTEAVDSASKLPNLEEGYVAYNRHGEPSCKIKNPAYVAIHGMRGEVLTQKAALTILKDAEVGEYLAAVPKDRDMMVRFHMAFQRACTDARCLYDAYNTLERRELALKIKDHPAKDLVFGMIGGRDPEISLRRSRPKYFEAIIMKYLKELP